MFRCRVRCELLMFFICLLFHDAIHDIYHVPTPKIMTHSLFVGWPLTALPGTGFRPPQSWVGWPMRPIRDDNRLRMASGICDAGWALWSCGWCEALRFWILDNPCQKCMKRCCFAGRDGWIHRWLSGKSWCFLPSAWIFDAGRWESTTGNRHGSWYHQLASDGRNGWLSGCSRKVAAMWKSYLPAMCFFPPGCRETPMLACFKGMDLHTAKGQKHPELRISKHVWILSTSISFNETLTSEMGDDTKFWRFFSPERENVFAFNFAPEKKVEHRGLVFKGIHVLFLLFQDGSLIIGSLNDLAGRNWDAANDKTQTIYNQNMNNYEYIIYASK